MTISKIHVLSRAVIVDQGHILMAYDPRPKPMHYYEINVPFFYLPGGHVEHQESAQKAVVRELEEETGCVGEVTRFLGVLEHAWASSHADICCHTHEINMMFQVHIPALQAHTQIPQKEDHVAFDWIDLNHFAQKDILPLPLKTLVPQWLEGKGDVFVSTIVSENTDDSCGLSPTKKR